MNQTEVECIMVGKAKVVYRATSLGGRVISLSDRIGKGRDVIDYLSCPTNIALVIQRILQNYELLRLAEAENLESLSEPLAELSKALFWIEKKDMNKQREYPLLKQYILLPIV